MRFEPIIASSLLEFFCSDAEHASITGDLIEQYQAGRSNFWYNRQVLAIVFQVIYNKIARRPLMRTSTLRTGENIILSVLLFAWASTLGEYLIPIAAILMTAIVFVLPALNPERRRSRYYAVGGLLLLAMSAIAGPEILIIVAPFLAIEAGVLLCWQKLSVVKFQALGLYQKK
jgi:hypothetical protein